MAPDSFLTGTYPITGVKIGLSDSAASRKVLRYLVNLKFKKEVQREKVNEALARIENLKNELPGIRKLEWGLNNSTEGLSKGFDYCFIITFNDIHAREIFVFHKAHLAAAKKLIPLLDDIFVIDYWDED